MNNIFAKIPAELPQELTEILLENKKVMVERIVSEGHCSPPGFWYDQDSNEWVILLSGSAEIEFAEGLVEKLQPGDYVFIPAHKKHRVKSTNINHKSVWLALFF